MDLSSLLDGLPDPAWMIDPAGALVDFNAAFVAFRDLVTGSEQEGWWRDLNARVRAGRSVSVDAHFVASGIERAFTIHGMPLPDGAFFVAREMTVDHTLRDDSLELALMRPFSSEPTLDAALTKAIELICASDAWHAAVVWVEQDGELAPNAVWLHDATAHADEFRDKVHSLRFAPGHGVPGRAWAKGDLIWVPDLFDESGLARGDVVARAGLHTVVAVPIFDSHQITGVLEVFDRTVRPVSVPRKKSLTRAAAVIGRLMERRRAEDERRRLVALVERKGREWALTFDAIPQPIYLTARDGTIVRLNRAARDLAATHNYNDVLGRTIGSLGDGEPWRTLRDCVDAVAESGETCTAHVETAAALFDVQAAPDPEEQRVIVILRDTTEVVRLQESVRRGENLAALGELVAGVAHQVKNPLFGMSMTVDLLQQQIGGGQETDEMIDALRKWLHRLDRLMESLLAYGKTWTLDLHPHGVKDAIEQAIDICRPAAAANGVSIELHAAEDATLLMDPQRLVHALENVITNAAQHSRRAETVDVTLVTDDDAAEIIICDHGPGFPEADLPRIFEPFFTRRRGGTGLGLSIAQRIVDEHGGIINAENRESGGAAVRVRVPRYDERTTATDRASHSDR